MCVGFVGVSLLGVFVGCLCWVSLLGCLCWGVFVGVSLLGCLCCGIFLASSGGCVRTFTPGLAGEVEYARETDKY